MDIIPHMEAYCKALAFPHFQTHSVHIVTKQNPNISALTRDFWPIYDEYLQCLPCQLNNDVGNIRARARHAFASAGRSPAVTRRAQRAVSARALPRRTGRERRRVPIQVAEAARK